MVEVTCSYNIELLSVQLKELTNKDLIELEAQRKDRGKRKK